MLDLTFLATGYRQHVFTRTGADDGWVYKVPVAFGRVLPFDFGRIETIRPRNPVHGVAHALLIRCPRPLTAVRNRALIAHFSRKRLREFRAMLRLLERLAERGADDVVLPYRSIPDANARLRVAGREYRYAGPVLAQKRADVFRVRAESLRAYDPAELIEAQHRLWAHGFAIVETGEILGPRSWSVVDGRLKLADTSSLTADRRLARQSLAPALLDERQAIVTRKLREAGSTFAIDEYCCTVRSEINEDTFDRLWGAALRRGRRAPR